MHKIPNFQPKLKSICFSIACIILISLFASIQNMGAQELKLKYLGVAGWEMTNGKITILVDPYISRVKLMGNPRFYGEDDTRKVFNDDDIYEPDTVAINKVITKADYILVHHSHVDHLADVPYIAKKTSAVVIATETSCNILAAYGIPENKLIRVKGGEDYQFENFSVRVVPSIHSALNKKHYFESTIYINPDILKAPLKIKDFIEGGSLMYFVRIDSHKILTAGSMNFLEKEVDGLKPDILIPGVNFSRLEIYKYTERLITSTGFPKTIIPVHWDNFRLPYGYSQEESIEKKVIPFIDEVKAVSPDSNVIIPALLETIIINN